MLKILNLKDKEEYIYEIAVLTQKEWGSKTKSKTELKKKIQNKIHKIKDSNYKSSYYLYLNLSALL